MVRMETDKIMLHNLVYGKVTWIWIFKKLEFNFLPKYWDLIFEERSDAFEISLNSFRKIFNWSILNLAWFRAFSWW